MPVSTQNQARQNPALPLAAAQSLDDRLSRLAVAVIDYARKAKTLHFRYCRRPNAPSSPHASLAEAIDALSIELRIASQTPGCQALASEFLKELASLGHQPPCQDKQEQRRAAQIINAALLDLR